MNASIASNDPARIAYPRRRKLKHGFHTTSVESGCRLKWQTVIDRH